MVVENSFSLSLISVLKNYIFLQFTYDALSSLLRVLRSLDMAMTYRQLYSISFS
jgi:hypothetical protein